MWRAVIVQAIRDAIMPDPPRGWRHKWSTIAASSVANIPLIRNKARAWLTEGSRDFVDVCDMAGVDQAIMRNAARRLLGNEANILEARRAFFLDNSNPADPAGLCVRDLRGDSELRREGQPEG